MARNKWYTQDEIGTLKAIIATHPDKGPTDLARLAHTLGLFKDRSEAALQAMFTKYKESDEKPKPVPQAEENEQLAIAEAENRRWEAKYNALIDNLFKGLIRWPEGPGVKVDIPTIKDAIREAEPERYRGLCEDFENQWEQEKAEKEAKEKKTPGRAKK